MKILTNIIVLIAFIRIDFAFATSSPRSPEPISETIDIHNLMLAPSHHQISQIVNPPSSPKDYAATGSSIVQSENGHSLPVHESEGTKSPKSHKTGRKPLRQTYKAQYMRDYRKRIKETSKEEDRRRNKRTVERRKEVRKINDADLNEGQIDRRRRLQRENYQRLKQVRGYGKKHVFIRKELKDKISQGIATMEEIEKFHQIKLKDRQYGRKKSKKNAGKSNATLPKPSSASSVKNI